MEVQYKGWYTGAGIEWIHKKSYWLEEGEEVGDSRAEGSSVIRDGGQAAMTLMEQFRVLESLQLEGS